MCETKLRANVPPFSACFLGQMKNFSMVVIVYNWIGRFTIYIWTESDYVHCSNQPIAQKRAPTCDK